MRAAVDAAVVPLLKEHDIPGMAVAIAIDGQKYYFNYGKASRESGRPVTENTLFELGSLSKTFTATLAAYAQATGALSLSDTASAHLPALRGSAFDNISLLELGTYTAGGLPLQFPDTVTDTDKMIAWYRSWKPAYPSGAYRLYSNPSIGLFGLLAARSMGQPYKDLAERMLFPKLGLPDTHIEVPQRKAARYAYGYSRNNAPTRVSPGMLDAQAYGVKSSAADMIRFLQLNMDASALEPPLREAIGATHVGYFQAGAVTQGLGWERYAYPVALDRLVAGNSPDSALNAIEAARLDPPLASRANALFNKTGSTNGFGAYAVFVPEKGIGIVMLANRNYPNAARIKAAYRILTALDGEKVQGRLRQTRAAPS